MKRVPVVCWHKWAWLFVGYVHVVHLDGYDESVRKMCWNSNEWEYRNTHCIVVHSFTVIGCCMFAFGISFHCFLGERYSLSAVNPTVIKHLTEHSGIVLYGMSA